jgi:hypothetical protein
MFLYIKFPLQYLQETADDKIEIYRDLRKCFSLLRIADKTDVGGKRTGFKAIYLCRNMESANIRHAIGLTEIWVRWENSWGGGISSPKPVHWFQLNLLWEVCMRAVIAQSV